MSIRNVVLGLGFALIGFVGLGTAASAKAEIVEQCGFGYCDVFACDSSACVFIGRYRTEMSV